MVGATFHRFFDGNTTVVQGLWGMVLFDTAAAPGNDLLNGYHALEGTSRYGAPGWVNVLQVLAGDLYVGGWFDVAGNLELGDTPSPGFPTNNLAVWHFATNGAWESVAGGTDAQVQAFAEADGALAVGGWFSRAGNTPAARVARYDPAGPSWHALGSGLGDGARGGAGRWHWPTRPRAACGWAASSRWRVRRRATTSPSGMPPAAEGPARRPHPHG